jgi:hypothetical protein
MFRRLKTFLVVMALGAAVCAAPASAQSCKAPPGMSAIDEYCEAIPAPSGDRGNTDTDRGGRPIPAATRAALEKQGAAGQAIIALSAPASKQGSKGGGGGTTAHPAPVSIQPDKPSANPLSALAAGFGDTGDTVGPLFGTLLLFFALVFFATAWLRYRRRAQS